MSWLRGFWKRLTSSGPDKPKKKQSGFIKKAKPQKVHVQVGLDFGTSSTKVAYRRLDDKRVAALDFKHGLKNYPSFVLPSIAAVVAGKGVVFGAEAAKVIQSDGLGKWPATFRSPR